MHCARILLCQENVIEPIRNRTVMKMCFRLSHHKNWVQRCLMPLSRLTAMNLRLLLPDSAKRAHVCTHPQLTLLNAVMVSNTYGSLHTYIESWICTELFLVSVLWSAHIQHSMDQEVTIKCLQVSTGVRGINEILTEPNEMQNYSKVGGALTVYIS